MTTRDLEARGVIRRNVSLGEFTTYKSGGPARILATIDDTAVLEELVSSGLTREHEVLVLGRGSNLVVADAGFDGLVIRLGGKFAEHEIRDLEVRAGGAVPLPRLARAAGEAGIAGLEFFVGVPGSVGGAVRQNAGCFGTETKDVLRTAEIFDLSSGSSRTADAIGLELSYRHSNLTRNELVVAARFEGSPGRPDDSKAEMKRITKWRKDNQPGGTFNAGSVFKNPPGISAGELIDSLGLKGLAVGDVSVSEKHANFFVAGAGATSADIVALVDLVKDRVFDATGTMLEPEIQFVGFEQ